MIVIFDMKTGEINEPEGSQPAPEEHNNTPGPEYEITARLQEVESNAATPEQPLPPLLHQEDADSFLHLMDTKSKQSR